MKLMLLQDVTIWLALGLICAALMFIAFLLSAIILP